MAQGAAHRSGNVLVVAVEERLQLLSFRTHRCYP
jgi:hypothetical protein